MTSQPARKRPPDVKEEVDQELPDSEGTPSPSRHGERATEAMAVRPAQAEPRSFPEFLDLSKLQFGQKLIAWCIALVIALTIIGHFWRNSDPNSTEITQAIEFLKLVTTTALGFVFAKTQMIAQQSGKIEES